MKPGSARTNEHGFVLVSVLWILAILTVISLGFGRRAMLERRMAWYALDREQAQQMARAAAQRGLFELQHKMLYDEFDHQAGYTGLDQRWARPIDLRAERGLLTEGQGDAFRDDVCVVRIEDAERRISINHAPRKLLEALKPLSFKTIDIVMARREMSTPGHQPALFHNVEELRELERIPEDAWFGGPDGAGLEDVLSVWGDPANGAININTAPAAVLLRLPGIEEAVVQQIMQYRNGNDGVPYTRDDRSFKTVDVIGPKTGISRDKLGPVFRHCKTHSRYFTITAHASRRRGTINAFCTVTVELQGARPVILEWREDTLGT